MQGQEENYGHSCKPLEVWYRYQDWTISSPFLVSDAHACY